MFKREDRLLAAATTTEFYIARRSAKIAEFYMATELKKETVAAFNEYVYAGARDLLPVKRLF